jgi:ABC-type Fe3+-siderophore transport system permease subunit
MKTLISAERVARIQGWFYLLTGVWPLASANSFQLVTGFKADFWLAQTVGWLLAVSGAVMLHAARARRVTPEIIGLGAGQAFVLALMDIYAVFQPSATPVYLLDVVVEAALIAGWLRVWRGKRAADRIRTNP